MNMQARLKAAKQQPSAPLEQVSTPDAATEVELPPVVVKEKKLELDSASQELLEENPIVPDAGKPSLPPAPNPSETPVATMPVKPAVNPLVWLGGLCAAGLLLLAGVGLVSQKPKFVNPMPSDQAPVPFVPPVPPKNARNVVEI